MIQAERNFPSLGRYLEGLSLFEIVVALPLA